HIDLPEERSLVGRQTATAPPCENDQDGQYAKKPEKCERAICDEGIARKFGGRDWRGKLNPRQPVDQRQNLAGACRSAGVCPSAIAIVDLTIGFLANR